MFEEFESFDQAFGQAPDASGKPTPAQPVYRRKTLSQKIGFCLANAIVIPLVALCYLTISSEGLRQTMPVFAMRLYKTPVPGAGFLREFDGFDRLDLSMVCALLLLAAVSTVWKVLFSVLMKGGFLANRDQNPVLFYLMSGMALVTIVSDAALFYLGVESRTASAWSAESSALAPAFATLVFSTALAGLGAWHADYSTSGSV